MESKEHSVPLSNFGGRNDTYGAAADDARSDRKENSGTSVTRKIISAMSITTHILIAGFTIYMLYESFETYSLFSWHVACMTVGAFLLMAAAIMAMSPDNVLAKGLGRQDRVKMHWILQALAAAFMFSGFLVIVINKNMSNRPHFTSNHGIVGLVSIILVGVTSLGGLVTLYSVKLKNFIQPAQIKLMHSVFGIITFIIGVVCLILGLFTNWYKKQGGSEGQIVCTIIVVIATIFTLQSAVIAVYHRLKRIISKS